MSSLNEAGLIDDEKKGQADIMDAKKKEFVILNTVSKPPAAHVLLVERIQLGWIDKTKYHVAGGNNEGIVINKGPYAVSEESQPRISIDFKVCLVNTTTQMHVKENRQLRFWFVEGVGENEEPMIVQQYFKELVTPSEFPRDYFGFLLRVMKLLQSGYPEIQKVIIEFKQVEETDLPPSRPLSMDENMMNEKTELTEEKVLEMIEAAYPTPISVAEMSLQTQHSEEELHTFLDELQNKGVVKSMENQTFTRVVQNETEVQVVKQMPSIIKSQQPSIAIITAQYCEKVAVDAMIENKETYFRYTTVGESNVYTLGTIGSHRVVATKLPTVGRTREAMIAAGNTTTRLLGTFQKVEYVFLVGVGGGVPHFTDYTKHVRLGDVVVSTPAKDQKSIYIYCESAQYKSGDVYEFDVKSWGPPSLVLQEIAEKLQADVDVCPPWMQYLQSGLEQLSEQDADFQRPDPETDKLYMSIGGKDVIEVGHPTLPEGMFDNRKEGVPSIHLGPVASGRELAREDHLRESFVNNFGVLAFDSEFDAVLESIYGSRKDSYAIIRGIADYKDGSRKKEWQPYAALAAASFTKAVICGMDPPSDD